jgi:hypothetical protein
MPAFLAHFRVLEMATDKYQAQGADSSFINTQPVYHALPKKEHQPISQWAYLGAMGPDMCAFNEGVTSWIFDVLHWKKTNSFVANWLAMPALSPAERAFIMGFLAHMAADIIVHPYVNTFAGAFENQRIPVAYNNTVKSLQATMHKYVELHQDCHLAKKYYGAASLSGQAGGQSVRSSWSDFIGQAADGDLVKNTDLKSLLFTYRKVVGDTLLTPTDQNVPTLLELNESVQRLSKALSMGYDWSAFPVPDQPEPDFVQHPKRDRRYEDYLWAAAHLTVEYWKAAKVYSDSQKTPEDRRQLLDVVRDFNLDTGFAPRVYSDGAKIHVRHDHSWALFLNAPTQSFDAQMPK